MAEIRKLQINNVDVAPVTHESAVLDNEGVSLPDKYVTKAELQHEIENLGDLDFDTSAIDTEINNLKTADTTMNGQITNIQNSINALQQIHYSTSEPTAAQGKNGDIWVVYKN
jgi:hypothetical protein